MLTPNTLWGVVRGAEAPLTLVRISRLCREGGEFPRPARKRFLSYRRKRSPQASFFDDQAFGPATTSALPASLPSYLAKFLMKRLARSLALVSHSEASA